MEKEEPDFLRIANKWQKRWKEEKAFEAKENLDKPKFYVLEMFPYPSGDGLHMGHVLNYSIGDVYARFKILKGFNVLHPIGYDALGLPAENAAIKAGKHPQEYTHNSIKGFTTQLKSIGLSYDWSRVVNTSSPDYYKWDQWIFLKMLEKGLAYQKTSAVNWCPKCETVLANEQVVNGRCWRHDDTEVDIRHLKQWFLKTTYYADELYGKIDELDWPEKTKAMQKNWIGKSHGVEIDFEINGKVWPVFTTRADTIFGVTFMVVAAQHPKLKELVTEEQKPHVEEFLRKIKTVSQKSMKEVDELNKEGVFTGSYAVNPANGERVPVYAGNFVVADYGSGMVMAVPAHDQRDFEFAKKYGIEIKQVIGGEVTKKRAYSGEGKLKNSSQFNDFNSEKAKEEIAKWLTDKKKARKTVNFKLRDWLISRQRYWGTPIPVIHCDKCGPVPVPEKELPVVLPKDVKFGKGNPLLTNEEWINVKCPKCSGNAKRETDTMDTFVNSSWYYLRYCDPKNQKEAFQPKKADYWCPIDQYIGGAEHACMHLIYIRFYAKFLNDLGLIKFREPAKKLFHQGMLYGEGGIKMSKSKGNVITPDEVSKKYGIDTARYFLLSIASPDKPRDWSEKGIQGAHRLVKKIFSIFENAKIGKDSDRAKSLINKTIRDVEADYEAFEFRAATIRLKELFEELEKEKEVSKETLEKSLILLNPICPHITEELWDRLGNKSLVSLEKWPECDESCINEKLEVLSSLVDSVCEDVRTIQKLVKREFSRLKLIVSDEWKYKLYRLIGEELSKGNKEIIKAVMASEFRKQGKDAMRIAEDLLKNPGKAIMGEISPEEEAKIYNESIDKIKSKLQKECSIEVITEPKSDQERAKKRTANPGKPAIVLE
jgi:leucyl-tRNA synthetase